MSPRAGALGRIPVTERINTKPCSRLDVPLFGDHIRGYGNLNGSIDRNAPLAPMILLTGGIAVITANTGLLGSLQP